VGQDNDDPACSRQLTRIATAEWKGVIWRDLGRTCDAVCRAAQSNGAAEVPTEMIAGHAAPSVFGNE
jgi:hypothetical protein